MSKSHLARQRRQNNKINGAGYDTVFEVPMLHHHDVIDFYIGQAPVKVQKIMTH